MCYNSVVKNQKSGGILENIKIIDMHTHTDNSFDGHHSAMFMAETAESKDFASLAFTDHCEVDTFFKRNDDRRTRQSFFEISKARDAFKGRLEILRGIELAQPHYDPELAEKIINTQHYDLVIGSLHNLRNQDDFYDWESFDGIDVEATMNEYFDEILGMLQWGNFDVLAHITYPFRYIFNHLGYKEDINKYSAKVDEILSLCAEKEKALEINMGGLKYPINLPSPDIDTVKRFRELGGKMISVGSDSHYADRLGFGIEQAYEMAREAGFTYVVKFVNRQPVEFPIV